MRKSKTAPKETLSSLPNTDPSIESVIQTLGIPFEQSNAPKLSIIIHSLCEDCAAIDE